MAKTMQEKARKGPEISTNSKRIGLHNAMKRDAVNCAIAGAETITKMTPLPRNNNQATQSYRIRKCVVKIKRIKLSANYGVKRMHNFEGASSVQPSGDVATVTACELNNKELFRIRNCAVRIKCTDLQAKNVAGMINNIENSSVERTLQNNAPNTQSLVALNNTVTDNVGDVTSFEPTRNSTMCTMSKVPTARARVQENAAHCLQANATVSKPRFFHRDQPTRTRSSVTRNVYEFLSQSQIEDNEVRDPAADIIKRMVNEGKACVVTRKKGKSRVRAARKKKRPVGKRRQCSLRSIGENPKSNVMEVDPPLRFEQPLSPIYEPQIDSSDEDNEPNEVHLDIPVQVHAPRQNRAPSEGAYSPLARSLMLNQTKVQNPQESIDRRRKLLNMAKKFFSTPMNQNMANAAKTSTLSAINTDKSGDRRVATLNSPSAGCSPWRVADDASLPNTFVFGLNTSQLPSYSSDFIRGRRHVYVPDEPVPEEDEEEASCMHFDEQNSGTVANDSNAENVPPSTKAVTEAPPLTPIKPSEGQENENEENYVQLPNPRRTLQYRSPLKDINILDVVILPSWKKNVPPPKTPTRESIVSNHVHFAKSIDNEANRSRTKKMSNQVARKQQQTSNLFGFEDFLDDENDENTNQLNVIENLTLHEKLQKLQGLRPADNELPLVSKAPMRHAYDNLEAHGPRQRNIKEMLCSTMIATPAPRVSSTDESVALFKDTDPEATFDENKPRRTYVRERPKRKRKKRVHVLFIDSDSSDSENDQQDSNENCAEPPKKKVPAHKRPRKDEEHDAKLKQFITSFNLECQEVEKFPLIIE